MRVIVVTDTLPYGHTADGGIVVRNGGNHAALAVARSLRALGADVVHVGRAVPARDAVAAPAPPGLDALYAAAACVPVAGYVGGASSAYGRTRIFPLFHHVLWDATLVSEQDSPWADYRARNRAYADAVGRVWLPEDTVWVMGHHLLLVPEMLRVAHAAAQVALYIRLPFPSSELFRCLPEARHVLRGMLGASVVGFQTHAYARHFLSSCTRVLGLETSPRGVEVAGATVEVAVLPMGTDPPFLREVQARPAVAARMAEVRARLGPDTRVVLGILGADHASGAVRKLAAVELFFARHPEFRGRVTLVQVICQTEDPASISAGGAGCGSPDEAPAPDAAVSAAAERLNAALGSLEWRPVHVHNAALCVEEYVALLGLADVLMVTTERDSVNTTIMDYVVCQAEAAGLPVVSEFIGLAAMLPPAFQVNPFDPAAVAESLFRVLSMDADDRRGHHEVLDAFVHANTLAHWAECLAAVLAVAVRPVAPADGADAARLAEYPLSEPPALASVYLPTPPLPVRAAVDAFVGAAPRVLLLDYDGTLAPICRVPAEAAPRPEVLRVLRALAADARTQVHVISGRDQRTLEAWLGDVPRLGLCAEHGTFVRPAGGPWAAAFAGGGAPGAWQREAMAAMEYYAERTPGAAIEVKVASIVWHYRQAHADFGAWQARELQAHLEETVAAAYDVDVVPGKRNVEVRPRAANKGRIVAALLAQADAPAFVFCAGDDRTDEDMFRCLDEYRAARNAASGGRKGAPEWCFTVSVGAASKRTLARHHVAGPEQLLGVLVRFAALSAAGARAPGATM